MESVDQTLIFTTMEQQKCFFSIIDEKLHLAAFDTCDSRDMDKIYVGKIANILPNLKAAFVEYKKGVCGFLPLTQKELKTYKCETHLPVQVVKDAVKTKEAVLSTELSLKGTYCIITSRPGGLTFSKKIPDPVKEELSLFLADRKKARTTCIIRTNAAALEKEDYLLLRAEIIKLEERLEKLLQNASSRTLYSRLYEGPSFVEKQIAKTDFKNISKIVTDSKEDFDQISQTISSGLKEHLRLYEDESFPLQALYGLKGRLHDALSRTVWLKSGGYLVIEPTEALTVIDVNSGKNLKKISKKELCLLTNREAAEAIPYILTSRNITGIIIVDFISTDSRTEDAKLLKLLRSHTAMDHVKTDVVDITPLGLVEITRQKRDIPLKDQLCEVGLYETFRH